jgi:hypothetical protein
MSDRDWQVWHKQYDSHTSALARRLATVEMRIRDAITSAAPGSLRAISMCAGEGRDLFGALDGHRRAGDVRARLVELDPRLAATAQERAAAMGFGAVEVVSGDASNTDAYEGAAPADLVLACGLFGNISDDDIANTVRVLPTLCAAGATVIWTRHRNAPDKTPLIRQWFADAGFTEVWFDAPEGFVFAVGTYRFDGTPQPFVGGVRLFTFVGYDQLPSA